MSAINAYFENLSELLNRTLETQQDALETAARQIANALRDGGMVYTFGTGHGHLLALEIFYRAGGMVRLCPILDEKLMLHISAAGSTLEERNEEWVEKLLEKYPIKAGDVLIAVEGQDIQDWDIDETKNHVRGEAGTQVQLTFRREGETVTLAVERRLVQTQVARYEMLEGNIGLVTIVNFDSRCAEETIAAIEALLKQGAEALIFDVRNNPGGYKEELVKILDYLLPEGDLFHSVLYNGTQEVDKSDAKCLDIPMAVLANGNSYSAAEFFAAALVEYEVATFVGQPTTGKGRFQTTFQLADGSAATISIGAYTTPKGVDLTNVGLTPDVLVEVDEEMVLQIYYGNISASEDPQIQKAVEILTK